MSVDYRVLGRLDVVRDGRAVDLGAFRQRALLALLIAHTGTVLSTDRILEELWAGTGGVDKQSSLWVYVSGLRTALEPQRAKRSEGSILLTRAPGYVLDVDPADTDVGRFERAVADARTRIESDALSTSRHLREALATWRGHAYEEFTYEAWAEAEISRLEELRLEAIELRVEADLQLGLARELVSELQGLVQVHPLRERLVGALMLSLYRSGRTAEALRAASSLRRLLVDELGVEPSLALRELEHQILVDDGSLLVERRAAGAASPLRAGVTVRGYELREEIGRGSLGTVFRAYQPLVGREVAVKVVAPAVADDAAFIRRFDAEAQLVAGLEHPHIVPLYDYWREPGAAYLVMRLVEGGDLGAVIEGGALPADRAARILGQVAGALAVAHRAGVVHGHLSPGSILVDREGNAYLSGFGAASAAEVIVDAETSVRPSAFVAPEVLDGRSAGPSADQYALAVIAAAASTGSSGGYDEMRLELAPAVRAVLDRATAADPTRRFADTATFGRALADALDAPDVSVPDVVGAANPYKGLRAFGTADAAEFYGRERTVARLVARLGAPGTRGRFVAVVGPSGSGKSSVVRAGLLPALARGALPASQNWLCVETSPAPHPFEGLESALSRIATEPPADLLETLYSAGGLRRAVHRVLPEDSQLLLVVDQFEELYTQVDEDTATRFVDELVDLVTGSGTRVRLVVTLRADFYDRPLGHRAFGELLREGTEILTPMSVEELESAITGPAGALGVDIDPRAVAEMVSEVVDRPGALPLLQYTLTELFDARTGRSITAAAYRAGGGVTRTLARRADSLLSGSGGDSGDTARQVFLRLVTLGDDGVTVSRRRALVAELDDLDRSGKVRHLLDTFGRHRLLTFDRDAVTRGPTVEISHEALLQEWATLREWLDDARDDLRARRHLAAEVAAWAAADHSPDYLLRGARLESVAAWAATSTLRLRPAEQRYVDASFEARALEQRAQQDEERRLADTERRASRRGRQLALAVVATVAVAVAGSVAWAQRQDARDARHDLAATQEAQRLVNLSAAELARDPELSLLLAVEAVRATAGLGYAVPEAIDATHWALQELGVQYDVASDTQTSVRSGPRGVQGVWLLPVSELVDHASANSRRGFTADECDRYFAGECPEPASASGLEYFGGRDLYAAGAGDGIPRVVVAVAPGNPDEFYEQLRVNLETAAGPLGVGVRVEQLPVDASASDALRAGFDADVLLVGPAELPVLSADHRLLDLRPFLDERTLVADYGEHLVSLTRVGEDGAWPSSSGPVHGVVIGADAKAMVWTREPDFSDAGYDEPDDWAAFVQLARTMVADGRTPLCFGIESGGFDGWPATDLVEALVLRSAGPEFYDSWIGHDVGFDHPVVVEAIRAVAAMVHAPGFLDTTPEHAMTRSFFDAWVAFRTPPDACMMAPLPSFMPAADPIGTGSLGSFSVPGADPAHADGVVAGGTVAVAVTDRPEVRALMAALASPEWGAATADVAPALMVPPNVRFDVARITDPTVARITSSIHEAIRADALRFDGSDAMPAAVEAAFRAAMVSVFRDGASDPDRLPADLAGEVEAVWRELDAVAGG